MYKNIGVFLISLLFIPGFVKAQSPSEKITPQKYIEKYKVIAIKERIQHQIPASITLAQGILESGSGNNRLACQANNHFGIKCKHDWQGGTFYKDDDKKNECFRKYKSPEKSFADHSRFLTGRKRYSFLFKYDVTDYKKWTHGLEKAGYATNPEYPSLLIELIKRYNLHRFDTMSLSYASKGQKQLKTRKIAGNKTKKEKKEPEVEKKKETDKTHANKGKRVIKRRNRIKYIIARPGDDRESIADEMRMWTWQIERYNELNEERKIEAGEIVYLQPKRRWGSEKYHTVKEGETMYEISQKYGIKLKHIYRKNRMDRGEKPRVGQKLWLKRRKPRN